MGRFDRCARQPSPTSSRFATTLLLLTDGTVLCRAAYTARGEWTIRPDTRDFPVTTDAHTYINAFFTDVTPPPRADPHAAGVVAATGEAIVMTYVGLAIFDPRAGTWTEVPAPGGLQLEPPMITLADGRVLVRAIELADPERRNSYTFVFDVARRELSTRRTQRPTCIERFGRLWGEFVLLPEGRVLGIACGEAGGMRAQIYDPVAEAWSFTAEAAFGGALDGARAPMLLLPDGRVLIVGHQRIYYYAPPATAGAAGAWTSGPEFPLRDSRGWDLERTAKVAFLLPSGRVLCGAHYTTGVRWSDPRDGGRVNLQEWFTVLFELDTAAGVLHPQENPRYRDTVIASEAQAKDGLQGVLLPTGQVLLVSWGGTFEVYTPDDPPTFEDAWRPRVGACPAEIRSGDTYPWRGIQFNGLSQANSNIPALGYGCSQNATNYPLVQIRRRGSGLAARYCPTRSHSSMGVATGAREVSTLFTVPPGLEAGDYELRVVANGIPSEWCQTRIPGGSQDDRLVLIRGLRAIDSVRVLGLVPADGGGLVIGPGGIQPVPPWDPTIHQALEALSPGIRKRIDEVTARAQTFAADVTQLAADLEALKQTILKQLETMR